MISYVVDTSVIMQAYIADTHSLRVMMLTRMAVDEPQVEINIPEFCFVECANVLWKHARQFQMPLTDIKVALNNLVIFPFKVHLANQLVLEAFAIAQNSGLAVYDATHIALAQKLNLPLITVDQKQAKAASAVGVLLKPITDFPEYVSS